MCERYLILEGSGWVEVGDALAGVVQRGSVVFIPPDVPQRIHSIKKPTQAPVRFSEATSELRDEP
jgi:mannose-6-phosphate isomerase-like protein (cupin superfamily)